MTQPMSRKTLAALEGSIKKWERIVEGIDADAGTENCPLCALFHPDSASTEEFRRFYKHSCRGCPVQQATGEPFCINTPYQDWQRAVRPRGYTFPFYAKDNESVMCAVLELEFLKSLLPRKRK